MTGILWVIMGTLIVSTGFGATIPGVGWAVLLILTALSMYKDERV